MTRGELRAKILALMASGALPSERPSIERRGSTEAVNIAVSNPSPASCTVCLELGSQVALFYPAGLVVRLHAACDALWRQEGQA